MQRGYLSAGAMPELGGQGPLLASLMTWKGILKKCCKVVLCMLELIMQAFRPTFIKHS